MATAYKYQDEVLNIHGDVVPFAIATVYLAGTGTLATLYANTASTIPLANPVTADYQGYFYFYAANGTYDIQVTGTGLTSRILTDVFLGTAAGGTTLPGVAIVDGVVNTTIQAAITAASTTGSVLIPSNYAGADVYTNPNTIQILDLRGKPDRGRGFINMLVDCGLKGDGVTDDATAANTCFAAYPGREFYFPKTQANGTCSYLFGAILTPSGAGTILRGDGGGTYGMNFGSHFGGTELCFTPGITGLWLDNLAHSMVVENLSFNGQAGSSSQSSPTLLNLTAGSNLAHYTRTISAIQRAANVLTVTVTGSNLEGLTVAVGSTVNIAGVVGDATMNGRCIVATISNSATNPLTFTCNQNGSNTGPFGAVGTVSLPTTGTNSADGIRICGNFHTIRHVAIGNFGRHGISAQSDDPICAASFADDLIVKDSIFYGNMGHGIFLKGADSNAGLFEGNSFYYNGLWGAHDQSFLGNTWIANQASYNGLAAAVSTTPTTKAISTIARTLTSGVSTVTVVLSVADTNLKLGSCVVIAGVTDASFNTTTGQCFFITSFTNSTNFQYEQPGAPANASSSGGTSRMAKFSEAYLSAGVDNGSYKIGTQSVTQGNMAFMGNYTEGGQNCKFGTSPAVRLSGTVDPTCVPNNGADWNGTFISSVTGLPGFASTNIGAFANNKDADQSVTFRGGISGGTTRSTYMRWYNNNTNLDGYALQVDPSGTDGSTGGWVIYTGLSTVRRFALFGKNNGGTARINSESAGDFRINLDANSGTGGTSFGSGGGSPSTVATIDSTGLGTFNGGVTGIFSKATGNSAAANINVYADVESTRKTVSYFKSADAGTHTTEQHYVHGIESRPVGSGLNGPTAADFGLGVSLLKASYLTNGTGGAVGEIDGINAVVRNSGTASDAAGILIDVGHTGTGYQAQIEGATQTITPTTGTVTRKINNQIGIIDNINLNYLGYMAKSVTGANGTAFQAQQSSGGGNTWAYFFRGLDTADASVVEIAAPGNISKISGIATAGNTGVAATFGKVFVFNQTASIGTTTLFAVPATWAGAYKVCYYAFTTTAGTGTTATVTIGWNDGNAKTFTTGTWALNSVGNTGMIQGTLPIHSALSQNITYAVTVGSIGTSNFALEVWVEAF